MHPLDPPAEIRQHSLFATPVARLYELQDTIRESKKTLREMETDYPAPLRDLIEKLDELKAQVKDEKQVFLDELLSDDDDYKTLRTQIAELQIELDEQIQEVKQMAWEEVKVGNKVDETIVADGETVRFQAQNELGVYINGKEL